jgi:hypothetical protein
MDGHEGGPRSPAVYEPLWVQSLSPFAGEWILTDRVGAPMGKMKLAMGETALSGRGVQPDGREGERFEFLFKHNADFDSRAALGLRRARRSG